MAEIILQRQEKFKQIVPMIGKLHLAKAVEYCLGNVLKETGN